MQIISDANNWKYTFTNLPKYDEFGNKISYSVVETETNVGDLEYYDAPVITVVDLSNIGNNGNLSNGEISRANSGADPATTPDEKIIVTNRKDNCNKQIQTNGYIFAK